MPPAAVHLPQSPEGRNACSRSFAVGLLVLLFLWCTQSDDWNAASAAARKQRMELRASMGPTSAQKQEAMRDKLLYELTVSNEKLERENHRLRQRMMLVNHALRSCGQDCANATARLPFEPFLGAELQAAPGEDEALGAAMLHQDEPSSTGGQQQQQQQQQQRRRQRRAYSLLPTPYSQSQQQQLQLRGFATNKQIEQQQAQAMPGLGEVAGGTVRMLRGSLSAGYS